MDENLQTQAARWLQRYGCSRNLRVLLLPSLTAMVTYWLTVAHPGGGTGPRVPESIKCLLASGEMILVKVVYHFRNSLLTSHVDVCACVCAQPYVISFYGHHLSTPIWYAYHSSTCHMNTLTAHSPSACQQRASMKLNLMNDWSIIQVALAGFITVSILFYS